MTRKICICICIICILCGLFVGCTNKGSVYKPHIGGGYVADHEGDITWTYNASDPKQLEAAMAVIAAFEEKYPDSKVTLNISQVTYEMVQNNTAGDVFVIEDTDFGKFVEGNKIMPLQGYVVFYRLNLQDVYTAEYASGKYDGNLYSVPLEHNTLCMIYNKDLLETLGDEVVDMVKNNWSWEDFCYISQLVTESNKAEYYGADINFTSSLVYTTLLNGSNEDWYIQSNDSVSFFDDGEHTIKYVEEFFDLAHKGYVNPGVNSKAVGSPLFTCITNNEIEEIGREYDSQGIEWDIVTFPGFGKNGCDRTTAAFSRKAVCASMYSEEEDLAAAFALFFYSEEAQRLFNEPQGRIPIIDSMEDTTWWRAPDVEEWSDKNWDCLVYEAHDGCVPGRIECVMPLEPAECLDSEVYKITNDIMTEDIVLQDAFGHLEDKMNELLPLTNQ